MTVVRGLYMRFRQIIHEFAKFGIIGVLGRLVATGTLTRAQAARAYRTPLHIVGGPGTGCAAR